ncbi:hypothetical protein QBC38DRAFT_491004 [Podospora fimiseda]|uniref:2EXR domain-containing protein n=1 Tax=Podospora fimiseda TaxID=252190 RepID=A0AAN6YNV5_9PEZI|nr:hypothetical protein QBC38DRAFT_491004 [Podospora fimiseda]
MSSSSEMTYHIEEHQSDAESESSYYAEIQEDELPPLPLVHTCDQYNGHIQDDANQPSRRPGYPRFGRNILIDDMAEEESEYDSDSDSVGYQHTFTQFKRLPLELRERVWEMFCTDLITRSRLLHFIILPSLLRSHIFPYDMPPPEVQEGATLIDQTEPARRVLSVHRESRFFALRSFPHVLRFRRGKAFVRFHRERDLVYLEKGASFDYRSMVPMPILPGFSENIQHVAIDPDAWAIEDASLAPYLVAFPRMRHAYFVTDYTWTRARDMMWAADEKRVCHYFCVTHELRPGLGEDSTYHWVWPNVSTPAGEQWALQNVNPGKVGVDDFNTNYGERAWDAGLQVWPVILFPMPHGENALKAMTECVKRGETAHIRWPDLHDSYDEPSDTDVPDEYESSGIDDDPIEQDLDEESEDDLAVADGSDSDSDNSGSDEDEEQAEQTTAIDLAGFNGFSDLESPAEDVIELLTDSEESNDGSDSDGPSSRPVAPKRLKRSRSRVIESDSNDNASETKDDDDDGDEEMPRKRARKELPRRKKPSISDSDEEESDHAPPVSGKRRALGRRNGRSIPVSEEDSDDESAPEASTTRKRTRHRTLIIESEDDSTEEERKMRKNAKLLHPEEVEYDDDDEKSASAFSESEEEEDSKDSDDNKPSRPLTLAQKLAIGREKYPIPPSDDEDDPDVDAEPMGRTDYDARDYADFQDDEEGEGEQGGEEEGEEWDGDQEQYFDDGQDYGEGGEW